MSEEKNPETPNSIEVSFKQGHYNRVIHVDGAWGGITPQGLIHMAVYSELQTLPEQATISIPSGQQVFRPPTGQPAVTREVEAELIMTPEVAAAIREWITGRLAVLEAVQQKKKPPRKQSR